jgi:hypothetical protein
LPQRAGLAPAQFRDGYRYLLLVALLAVIGLAVLLRKRPLV